MYHVVLCTGDQILFRFSFGFELQGDLVSWGHSSSIGQLFLEKINTNSLTSLSGDRTRIPEEIGAKIVSMNMK